MGKLVSCIYHQEHKCLYYDVKYMDTVIDRATEYCPTLSGKYLEKYDYVTSQKNEN